MLHNEKLQWKGPALSTGSFQKDERELIYFPYVVQKIEKPP